MRLFRALFWIVAVSLLLAGGNGFAGYYESGPGAELVSEDSPAYQSASRVVASVSRIEGVCADYEGLCGVAASAGQVSLDLLDKAMGWVMSFDGSSPATGSATAGVAAPLDWATGDGSFFHELRDISDVLYNEGDELNDIG